MIIMHIAQNDCVARCPTKSDMLQTNCCSWLTKKPSDTQGISLAESWSYHRDQKHSSVYRTCPIVVAAEVQMATNLLQLCSSFPAGFFRLVLFDHPLAKKSWS